MSACSLCTQAPFKQSGVLTCDEGVSEKVWEGSRLIDRSFPLGRRRRRADVALDVQ